MDVAGGEGETINAARNGIARMGPLFNLHVLKETAKLYAPLVRKQKIDGVIVEEDVAYGPDVRHRFDLFRPANAENAPLLIFIHGGGFVHGGKMVDEDFYRNIGVYFASRGVIAMIANYRLAPQHVWPAGTQDVASLVAWASSHASAISGDANAIFLFGQSAGAAHVAGYLSAPEYWVNGATRVAAGVAMSGVYRAFGDKVGPGMIAYFGDNEDIRRANCPLTRAPANQTPMLIGVMEFDPPEIAVHSFELAAALTRATGRAPRFVWFEGHNHASTVYAIGSGHDDVGETILRFIAEQRALSR